MALIWDNLSKQYLSNSSPKQMAKLEIHKRSLNVVRNLMWRYWFKHDVIVPWPSGWVTIHEMPDGSKTDANSADPNDWYRPWLEKNCGQQAISWDWRIAANPSIESPGYEDQYKDRLHIRFRNAAHASAFALRYA